MNKVAIKIFQLSILLLFVVSGCNDDDTDLNEASHRVVFTSEMDFENTIEVKGEISFGDVSSGVESRTWTFPDNVVDIVDSENDKTSTEGNVKTIWNEIGVFEVNLQQTFSEDAFVGTSQQGRDLDTNIFVTVLDSIQIDFIANYINPDGTIGAALNISNNAQNEIPAARSVRFTWTGKGKPDFYSWDFEKADPITLSTADSIIDVKYKFLGTFDLSLTASRARPFGLDTSFFENFIKVIPSTDPVVIEEIYESDGDIALSFQRELEPNTLEISDFSMSVYNGTDLISNTIASASLDPNQGNVVLLDLGGDEIYNNDSIVVSFIEGNLMSLDGVTATGFMDELLVFRQVNLLENTNFDYGFEETTSDQYVSLGWAGFDLGTFGVSSEQAFKGNSSISIELEPLGGVVFKAFDLNMEQITFPANASKDYELGSWLYLEEIGNSPVAGPHPDLRYYWEEPFGGGAINPLFDPDFPLNQWVFNSEYVNFDETGDFALIMRAWNSVNPEACKFYIDNLVLYEVNLR